jgi:type I restriction enzyme S subunit
MEVKPGYRQTEVGIVPDDWDVKALSQLGQFKNGINKGKEDFGHGFPFINLMDVFGIPRVSTATDFGLVNSSAGERKLYELKEGDVLFVRSSVKPEGVGLTTLIPKDLADTVFSGFLIRFRDTGVLDRAFKEYCFWEEGFRRRLISNSTVSANTNINQAALKRIQIAVPPTLLEQQAIAKALGDVDALLGGLERLRNKKRDLKQAAMQQLLTGQTRLPGFDGDWEVRTLGDLFNFSGGFSASRDQLSSEGHCYLHYGDIHGATKTFLDTRADYQQIPKLDIPLNKISPNSMLDDGDVVFVDASEDDEGTSRHVVVANKDNVPFIAGLHTIVAKSKTDELSHEYRRYCFQTRAIREQFLFYAVGTKVSGISKTNIPKLTLPVPSIPEQRAIAAALTDVDGELAALEKRLAKTRALKQGMMQELLTGKTRLFSPEASYA